MEITYDREGVLRLIHLARDPSGDTEMKFTKPVGLVPLVKPSTIENTAAYYLAAIGGTWERQMVSIVFVILWVMLMCIFHKCFAVRAFRQHLLRNSAYGRSGHINGSTVWG